MDNYLKLNVELQKEWEAIRNGKRQFECLIPGCTNKATTTSHILQKQTILKTIADETNHFYQIERNNLFKMPDEGPLSFKKVGLNEGFKFPLFCSTHDNSTFSPIEKNHPVDFTIALNASLLTYRTICMELRKKEISIECYKSIYNKRKEILKTVDYIDLKPIELALKDVLFYKTELEKSLFNGTVPRFNFKVVELPIKKICFSTGLSINDPNNPLTHEYDEWGYTKEETILLTFLNYFPYYDKCLLIVAQHINFPCSWTIQLLKDINDELKYHKILSDLLTYRIEQWGMSPEIYNDFSEEKKSTFINELIEHIDNYEFTINSNFNLFE